MAYRLVYEGRHKDKYRTEKGHVLVLAAKIGGEDVLVTRDEVKTYVEDPEFDFYFNVYQMVKLWGMPNGRGWAEEDKNVIEAITALELEAKALESEEVANAGKRTG